MHNRVESCTTKTMKKCFHRFYRRSAKKEVWVLIVVDRLKQKERCKFLATRSSIFFKCSIISSLHEMPHSIVSDKMTAIIASRLRFKENEKFMVIFLNYLFFFS